MDRDDIGLSPKSQKKIFDKKIGDNKTGEFHLQSFLPRLQ
jgi:hypothetical protein